MRSGKKSIFAPRRLRTQASITIGYVFEAGSDITSIHLEIYYIGWARPIALVNLPFFVLQISLILLIMSSRKSIITMYVHAKGGG